MHPATSGSPAAAVAPTTTRSPYLTRRETARYLNISEKWLAQSGRSQGPRFYKFGASCRYLLDDVTDWARQQRVVF